MYTGGDGPASCQQICLTNLWTHNPTQKHQLGGYCADDGVCMCVCWGSVYVRTCARVVVFIAHACAPE